MSLTDQQKKSLRRLGHALHPIVMVGDAGASEAVIRECNQALDHHELVKVRVRVADRELRDATVRRLARETRAEIVQRIGHVALLYRRNPDKPGVLQTLGAQT